MSVAAIKRRFPGKSRELDMTQGSIIKNLLTFALPLLVGNLFQQFYSMVDTWVIGQTGIAGFAQPVLLHLSFYQAAGPYHSAAVGCLSEEQTAIASAAVPA